MEDKIVMNVMGMDSSKYGGIERFNVELAKSLLMKGYKSVFVYEDYPTSYTFVDDLNAAGGVVAVLNSRKNKLLFCKKFVKLLKQYRPVLVHAHFTKARFYAIPIAYLMGVRLLYFTIHSAMLPKKQIKSHTRLWYHFANRIAKVVVVSDDILSAYKSNWPEAVVRRIYLGVKQIEGDRTECRTKLGIPRNQMVLLTVANFNYVKGLDVLCKAIKILKAKEVMEKATLYVVGQPETEKEELKRLVDELELGDSVMLVGISNNVPSYLVSADIYIQPSRSEGIGLALMEASSSALPLVGTKVGGIPEVVINEKNGILVEPDNIVELAMAILRLMSDEDLRRQYGEISLKVYEASFSVSKGVCQTIDYYNIQ